MQLLNTCNRASLAPYVPSSDNPWNMEKAAHLLRRTTFGGSYRKTARLLDIPPSQAVDAILEEATALPQSTFVASKMSQDDLDKKAISDFLTSGLRGTMLLFWKSHFATQKSVYNCTNYALEYYNLLYNNGLGDFRELVVDVGTSNAMLRFANGADNSKDNVNEDYARILFEYHLLGSKEDYSDQDICEAAKAFTGFTQREGNCGDISFDPGTFDPSPKTVLGQTGNWTFDQVLNILFEQKSLAIAEHVCRALYQYFVSPSINETIVDELALIFRNDFDISNILSVLLKSEHFFDTNAIGTVIKSPFDLIIGFMRSTGPMMNADILQKIVFNLRTQEQKLFQPPGPGGWPGNQTWIDSFYIRMRRTETNERIKDFFRISSDNFKNLAVEASGNSNDPEIVVRSVIEFLVPKGIFFEKDYERIIASFKRGVPNEDYENGIWNLNSPTAPDQLLGLFLNISRLPEFQLK